MKKYNNIEITEKKFLNKQTVNFAILSRIYTLI